MLKLWPAFGAVVSSHLSAPEIRGGLALTVYRSLIASLQAFGRGFFVSFLLFSWPCTSAPLDIVYDTDETSEPARVPDL